MSLYLVNDFDMSVRLEPIVSLNNGVVHGFEVLSKVDEIYNLNEKNGFDYEAAFSALSDDDFLFILMRQFEIVQKWVCQHPEIYSGKMFYFNLRRGLLNDIDFPSVLLPFSRTYEISLEIDASEFNDTCSSLNVTEGYCFEKLRDMGIGIWVDDYYGHPLVVKEGDVEGVKIDRKYFWRVFLNGQYDFLKNDLYISNITNNIIIEGVETREQHEFATKCGGILGQGYLWKELIVY